MTRGKKIYWQLFASFFKIGLFTFGGGYAMLPLMQRELFKHKWVSKKEILDYYALAQITPGIIAVNVSTFIGYKLKGVWGALCTMAGIVLPSLIIITVLVKGLQTVWESDVMKNAFAGIQLMVPALILPIVMRMVRDRAKNTLCVVLMFVAFGLVLCGFSPIVILLLCGSLSALWFWIRTNK